MKVLYNNDFGGFSLSEEFIEQYPEYNEWDVDRGDQTLIERVEKFGLKEAGGFLASLAIIEISGNKYWIKEYDGLETVYTPETINWETAHDLIINNDFESVLN